MGPSITNNVRPAVLAPSVLPGGVGQGSATPGLNYEEEAAAYRQYEEQARDTVSSAFAGASGVSKLVGIFAREPASASSFFATLSNLCDEPQYSEHFGAHINIPRGLPLRWLEDGAVTKQTLTTAKSFGWNAVKHNDSLFLLPPSSVLSDIISSRDYQLLSDAGVVSAAFANAGKGLSNLDLLEMELFNVAPSVKENIFYPDHYSFRSLDEAFDEGYLLVHISDTNFLIREEFLSQDSRWTLLRLKTAGVVHVRGKIGLEGDDKAASQDKGRILAADDIVAKPSGGELDLAELQVRQWERWPTDPKPVVVLSKYEWLSEFTDLHNWLEKNIKYVEPQDLERLGSFITAARKSEAVDALDLMISYTKGILAEIAARFDVHAEYLKIQNIHKDAIMLVAPQIYDGNTKEASDAVIGEITDDGKMKIYSVWEITIAKNGAEAGVTQLNDTLQNRFAERGVQIRDEQKRGKTLEVVLAEGIAKNIMVVADNDITRIAGMMREQALTRFDEEYIVSRISETNKSKRSRYSSATLIQMLQLFAIKLGHTPKQAEVKASLDMPTFQTYHKQFGGFSAALKAAGLEPNLKYYTEAELLDKLKALARKLGHTPTTEEVKAAPDMPSLWPYENRFDNFNAALKAAGLEPNFERYTRIELLNKLKALEKKLGHTPTEAEMKAAPDMPTHSTYSLRFGSYNAALKAAGFEPNLEHYTKAELLEKLKALAKSLGHTPTQIEIGTASDMPSAGAYIGNFGSFNAALKAAGLQPSCDHYTKAELLEKLKAFAKRLGHTPTNREVAKDKDMPSSTTYQSQFGTFNAALKAAGLGINLDHFTPAKLSKKLIVFAKSLGHVPTANEVKEAPDMPTPDTYRNQFGSFSAALEAIEKDLRAEGIIK